MVLDGSCNRIACQEAGAQDQDPQNHSHQLVQDRCLPGRSVKNGDHTKGNLYDQTCKDGVEGDTKSVNENKWLKVYIRDQKNDKEAMEIQEEKRSRRG